MERIIRRLLIAWLLLLGSVLVAHHCGYARLAYWLVWPVALGTPVVAVLLLWLEALRLPEIWHRIRVLWRARHWRRPARSWNLDEWSGYPGEEYKAYKSPS